MQLKLREAGQVAELGRDRAGEALGAHAHESRRSAVWMDTGVARMSVGGGSDAAGAGAGA